MRPLLKKVTIFFCLILSGFCLFAQSNPVSWSTKVKELGNNTFQIIFEASIEDGFHMYDMGPYTGGPNATTFTFEQNGDIELIGKPEYITKPVKTQDAMFGMQIGSFEGIAQIGQKVRIKSEKAVLKANVEWMSCNDQSCIPPTDEDFTIQLNGIAATSVVANKENNSSIAGQTQDASQEATAENAANQDAEVENASEQNAEQNAEQDAVSEQESTIGQDAQSNMQPESQQKGGSIWSLILQALAWGIAALATPCVFPMIPMTVSYFIKGSDNKAKGRFRAFMYGLFIVLLYTLPIGIIITLTWILGGESVTADIFNWIATHWLPNIIFFIVFMVFAASFFGAFEIVMPSKLVNDTDRKSDKKGLGGIFFMALTLVLVSFSCTGPIVGTVLIKSTSGEFWAPILTMLAFSISFALPFTLFALFPAWLKKLPKSGGWLNTIKVVLGFIEIALGLKFLSTADQTYQWGILDREVYLAIWIVVFALLGFYLLGKLKFKHDSPVEHISVTRLVLAIASFSFVVYMLPGMWGAPLKAISGYLPPMSTQDFVLNTQNIPQGTTAQPVDTQVQKGIKYGDSGLHFPIGMSGFFDLAEGEAYAEKIGKPLFIDFTGLGCMNCREMEARVLSDAEILQILRDEYVVVSMVGDDKKTKVEPQDWIVTDGGKTLKTLGKINSYIALKEFGINAQPYYILKGHGKMLVPPRGYNLDIEEFKTFLRQGIAAYKAQ